MKSTLEIASGSQATIQTSKRKDPVVPAAKAGFEAALMHCSLHAYCTAPSPSSEDDCGAYVVCCGL